MRQRPAILYDFQQIIKYSPGDVLRDNENGRAIYPMELFLDLEPSPIAARLTPLCQYRDLERINEEQCRRIAIMRRTYFVVEQIHEDVSGSNQSRRTIDQKAHKVTTGGLPISIEI